MQFSRAGRAALLAAVAIAGMWGGRPHVAHAATSVVVDTTCTQASINQEIVHAEQFSTDLDLQLSCMPTGGLTYADIPFSGQADVGALPISLTIELAPSAPVTVALDGQDQTPLLQVETYSSVTLRGLTLTRGSNQFLPGGAITNNGNLTLDHTTISNSSADGGLGGAIYNNAGTVTVLDSTLSGNHADSNSPFEGQGGAIWNANGTLTVVASTFVGNHADGGLGGAIINQYYGTVILSRSTLYGNHADGQNGQGGAIVRGFGGAIYAYNNSVAITVTASTIVANHADNHGTGGAFENNSALTLQDTIVAANTAYAGPEISGSFSGDHNAIGGVNVSPDTAANAGLSVDGTGAAVLADNGGPTLTVALDPANPAPGANPALDTGTCAVGDMVDQRGDPRPDSAGTACDIGAFESNALVPPTDTATATPTDTATATPTDTATATNTPTATATSTATPTNTPVPPTATDTATATATSTATDTATATDTDTATATDTPTATPPSTLYDQTDNPAGSNTASCSDVNPGCHTEADDFVVPAGAQWTLSAVDVVGGTPQSFNVFIFADAGGLPGQILSAQSNLPYAQSNPSPYGVQDEIAIAPVTLQPGHYWVAVQSPKDDFNWTYRSTVANDPAAFTWTCCGSGWQSIGSDFLFSLKGSAGQAQPTSTPLPSTATPTATATIPAALTLNRGSARYKDPVTASGLGFGPNETVNLYLDSTASAALTGTASTAGGSFSAVFSAPQAISGTHTVIALGQSSGLSATAPLTILPGAYLLHYQGTAGTVDVLKGTGFAPHETVVGYWNAPGGTPFTVTATTNPLGTFGGSASYPGITFTVPLSPTGQYPVYAVGQRSHGRAQATFTLRPHLSVTPASATPGAAVTVAGTGYGAHETVTLRWNCRGSGCAGTTVLGTPTTDANGNFSVQVTVPSSAHRGAHAIGGTGSTSGVFATATLTVT